MENNLKAQELYSQLENQLYNFTTEYNMMMHSGSCPIEDLHAVFKDIWNDFSQTINECYLLLKSTKMSRKMNKMLKGAYDSSMSFYIYIETLYLRKNGFNISCEMTNDIFEKTRSSIIIFLEAILGTATTATDV